MCVASPDLDWFIKLTFPMPDRMPQSIGAFISQHVYNNRLKTQHTIAGPSACQFVDVSHGREGSAGHSWVVRSPWMLSLSLLDAHLLFTQNEREIQAVVHVARKLQREGKSFRVITPYDSQRGRLETALKAANLVWEDKCFNVDSFQGSLPTSRVFLSVMQWSNAHARKRRRLYRGVACAHTESRLPHKPAPDERDALKVQETHDCVCEPHVLDRRRGRTQNARREDGGDVGGRRVDKLAGSALRKILNVCIERKYMYEQAVEYIV